MAITYVLQSMYQVLPNADVLVDVQAISDDEKAPFSGRVQCPMISGLSGDFDNAELLAAVCKATGLHVVLPNG